jgi:signal transduction histidine kinase
MFGDAGGLPAKSRVAAPAAVAFMASVAGLRFGLVETAPAAIALFATVLAPRRHRDRTTLNAHVDAAVARERRRIACDIHDGLAQDLAFVAARVRVLERDPGASVRLDHVASAADRALDHSRMTIATLTRPHDEPLEAAISRNATEVAERHGGHADLRLRAGVVVPPATRESLVHIVREAVTNAMRHGRAARVEVSLSQDDAVRLSIADDGRGFDAAAPAPRDTGFGLLSMEERAQALGGRLAVRSAPGSGTRIVVDLPCPAA